MNDVFQLTVEFYDSKDEYTLKWNDKSVKVSWPIKHPIVSNKDKQGMSINNTFNLLKKNI